MGTWSLNKKKEIRLYIYGTNTELIPQNTAEEIFFIEKISAEFNVCILGKTSPCTLYYFTILSKNHTVSM